MSEQFTLDRDCGSVRRNAAAMVLVCVAAEVKNVGQEHLAYIDSGARVGITLAVPESSG